ncbi:MAG TPA: ECF transporter S component [Elusimicrobiales bacterium]|nr:ECF transporter S component [Elusimicrobiales bacterium]
MQQEASLPAVQELSGVKSAVFQLSMITAAVLLPSVCHLTGAPVTVLLPMHWPVLAAGLFCGWRAGLTAGAAAPLISFALSGMPPAAYLPRMIIELACYGLVAGFARERLRLSAFAAVLAAVIAGRAAYMAAVAAFYPPAAGLLPYFKAALLPGLAAALGQALLLPLAYKRWADGR